MKEVPYRIEERVPSDLAEAKELLSELIVARKLVKDRLESGPVQAALELLAEAAGRGADQQRLEAVSVLGKAAEVSKPVADIAQPLLRDALQAPLPHTGEWGAADDRYYLAKGAAVSDATWIVSYAAVELAQGDVAERRSREIWAEIAIHRSNNLADALTTIGMALADDRSSSGYSADTACRKLNRILAALAGPLSLADVPPGDGFGKAFSDLVLEAGGIRGPDARPLREETALSVLDLLTQVLRLRFAVTMDAEIYRAAKTVLGWWGPARPPEEVNDRADRIARLAMDSLHVLARQGVASNVMRDALTASVGRIRVNAIGESIARGDPSLSPELSAWLASGRVLAEARASSAVREMNEQALDELIANLLLAVDVKEGGAHSLEMLADQLDILEPDVAVNLRAAAGRSRLIVRWAKAIATRRRLNLVGERGELVAYDPAIHDADVDLALGEQTRIRAPAVLKELEGRPTTIVKKALVERA